MVSNGRGGGGGGGGSIHYFQVQEVHLHEPSVVFTSCASSL